MITRGIVPGTSIASKIKTADLPGAQYDVNPRPPVPVGLTEGKALLADAKGVVLPATAPFRVTIIEFSRTRLVKTALEAMRGAVEAELNLAAAASHRPKVQGGFKVGLAASDAVARYGPTEFMVCLVRKNAARDVFALVKKQLTIQKADEDGTLARMAKQLEAEGGVNVAVGTKSVSIVAVDRFEGLVSGPMSDSEREETAVKAGRRLAELVLHELGHAMGAGHGDGLMNTPLVQALDDPVLHFSAGSRREILKSLEARVQMK